MGISPSVLRLLARACASHSLSGSVLTLGNQHVWGTLAEVSRCLREEGCRVHDVVRPRRHTSPYFSQLAELNPLYREHIHAQTLFELLGFTAYADLDKFAAEQPIIRHDLNTPIPEEHHGRYDLIVDSGTTEHVFNVPQVLASVVQALRPGGWVFHALPLPCTAWADHGYYAFHPDLFADFYRANGFQQLRCHVYFLDPPTGGRLDRELQARRQGGPRAHSFEYRRGMSLGRYLPPAALASFCLTAQKGADAGRIVVPDQGQQDAPAPAAAALHPALRRLYHGLQPLSGWGYRRWQMARMERI